MLVKFNKILVLLLLMYSVGCFASVQEQQRRDFLLAEQMIELGDEQGYLVFSAGLESYPLYFYLNYQWLSLHLDQDKQIQDYLSNSKQSLYTRKLRRKWLNYLYKQGKWDVFVANYKRSKSKQMQCRYNWAEYQRNYKTKALTATQKIWLTGSSLPKDCDRLLEKFTQSSFLTQKLIWQRFMLAVKGRQYSLATYLSKKLTNAQTRKNSEAWLRLVKKPELIYKTDFFQGLSNSGQAENGCLCHEEANFRRCGACDGIMGGQKSSFDLTDTQINKIQRAIALQLAFNKSAQAYAHFG
ncbi:hypothetical protein [Bathymodiolus platifrons methanotrophic gill symbiont]|uniref:hypothetical protein n=1 Tax=Bathymodiolus platifrons methanotrophic gill symbiont TaxID=113268 RepID=UPI001C8DDF93|nr:hypothetical protein [Bathymodiolus platifrons methanotrophic gill symbiont]